MLIQKGEYQGKPTIILANEANERYTFSFGSAKALKLIKAIVEQPKEFFEALVEITEDELDAETISKLDSIVKVLS